MASVTGYAVHPRERVLRFLLCVSTLVAVAAVASFVPFVPAVLVTTLYVVGSVHASFAACFYLIWVGVWMADGESTAALIGDASYASPPYFPWSSWVERERRRRRIAELERSVGLGPDGRFHTAAPRRLAGFHSAAELLRARALYQAPLVAPPVWAGDAEVAPSERPPTDEEWQATFGKQDDAA